MTARTKKRPDPELAALLQLRDEDIDTSDIPEVTDWSKAVVGKFYRPVKEPVTLRLDADLIAWLKLEGPGYQTRINSLLRTVMTRAIEGLESRTEMSQSASAVEQPSAGCQILHFPSLEKRGELHKYRRVAEVIEKRRSVFAPAS